MSLVGNLAGPEATAIRRVDRKSTRLNSSHSQISYAVFCLKKKTDYYTGSMWRTSDVLPHTRCVHVEYRCLCGSNFTSTTVRGSIQLSQVHREIQSRPALE